MVSANAKVKMADEKEVNFLNNRKKKHWKATQWMCFAIVLIPLVAYVVFNGFPILISFISMFTDMRKNNLSTMHWNNFENFIGYTDAFGEFHHGVFNDPRFWKAWGITLWLASAQIVSLLIALLIAVLLEQKIKGAKIFQVLFFIPYICSSIAVAVMWSWIFAYKNGILNSILNTNINWLNNVDNPYTLTWAVFVTILWTAPCYGIVMYKAALRNVNPALYEAASIDGLNSFQKFRYITFPGIRSVTYFLILAGITAGLTVFDQVTVLAPIQWTQVAGPNDAGLTIMYYIYLQGVESSEMEYAAVMSWMLFLVMFIFSFIFIKLRNKVEENSR